MFLNLLEGQFLSNLTTGEAFIMVILVGVAGIIVQMRLRSVVEKYSKVPLPAGMTGAQIAEMMLRQNGVTDVKVTHVGGYLTDHYDPRKKTVISRMMSITDVRFRLPLSLVTSADTLCSTPQAMLRCVCARRLFRLCSSRRRLQPGFSLSV